MINVVGSILGSSGYDIHTRSLANELNKLIDVKLITNLIPGWERLVNDEELKMIKRKEDNDINLIITNPIYWKINCNAKRNWVYCVWEGDKVPDFFIEEMLSPNIEYIIVPSQHTKDAVMRTMAEYHKDDLDVNEKGSTTFLDKVYHYDGSWDWDKIKIIPHGVDLSKFYPTEKKSKVFTFLANKGFRNMEDRGGIQYLIKAYLEEFKPTDNVRLVLKINPAYGVPNLSKMGFNFGKDTAPVLVNATNMKYEDLNGLYNECDVFVSPTRAESFNIPCLEAMACGKPVITTNFGGQTDYVNEENGWLIDYDLTEVKHEVEYEGIKWATPKIEDLRAKLRKAYENQDFKGKIECAKQKAKELTWANTAKQVINLK